MSFTPRPRFVTISKILFLAIFLGAAIMLQTEYDVLAISPATGAPSALAPSMERIMDFGFHPAVASFLWANTMPQILDLFFRGQTDYLANVTYVNAVDPKMSFPYAFSVLVLPVVPTSTYPSALADSFTIGERGIKQADPDWRIPYYMAINYYLQRKDFKDATQYFNIAAQTPGVPDYAARFALNFGINQKERDRVRGIWETIYLSTNDPDTKARAAAYVERLNDFDYLEAAARAYKAKFGAYPTSTAALVTAHIIPAVPSDPFGFTFTIAADGTAGIDKTILPAYLQSAPTE